MKQKVLILFVLFIAALVPYAYSQANGTDVFKQEGIASWYGKEFDGRPTASGEIYDSSRLTAAHPNLPFGTVVVITNQHNNKKVTVKVNDRGPFVAARIIDVSRAAAEQLDMIVTGTAPVLVESVERIVVSKPVESVKFTQTVEEVKVVSAPAVVTTPAASQIPITTVAPQIPIATTSPQISVTTSAQQIPVTTAAVYTGTPTVETYFQQPAVQSYNQIKLTPEISIAHNKTYRLQIGSYRVAKNAVDTFERLKNAGLNPAYERHEDSGNGEFFRVVLAGIRGDDVQSITEKLSVSGFREALIRQEN